LLNINEKFRRNAISCKKRSDAQRSVFVFVSFFYIEKKETNTKTEKYKEFFFNFLKSMN